MKLELNTSGSWRTVLRGLTESLHPQHLAAAKEAANTLAAIDRATSRRPQTWRLVTEDTDRVVAYCRGDGWEPNSNPQELA